MKKDLIDLEHDIESDIPTPMVGDVPPGSSKNAEPIYTIW